MKENHIPFDHLNEEMERRGICMKDLSRALHLPLLQLQEKLTGRQILFLDEAIRIRNTYFPILDIRYLFARSDTGCGQRETSAGKPVKATGESYTAQMEHF